MGAVAFRMLSISSCVLLCHCLYSYFKYLLQSSCIGSLLHSSKPLELPLKPWSNCLSTNSSSTKKGKYHMAWDWKSLVGEAHYRITRGEFCICLYTKTSWCNNVNKCLLSPCRCSVSTKIYQLKNLRLSLLQPTYFDYISCWRDCSPEYYSIINITQNITAWLPKSFLYHDTYNVGGNVWLLILFH